ncbi:uncharacterized protein LOC141607982 [Silene latifolia]|uniref:uncharacterized protein LOC141607982 n=1 Tax=Silene latifolia TaxID=37657 RepID=UPI003D76F8B0
MTCIRSTSFSLCLNGSIFGYFKGKRGLRQGDPISPLIFTICMDYLTRMINYAVSRWPFQYHPLCKASKLNHLMFSDDLLMFCKGNAASIMLLLRVFSSFSRAYGLSMNSSKSEVYYNGVGQQLKDDIQWATGFVEGSMPFRYLGVPIKVGRLTKSECNTIAEKMVSRIRSLGARKISYAGITYGMAMLNIIESLLLPGTRLLCLNMRGCLGIKKARVWNYATVAKLVDWIYGKADRFWIRWINQVYLKGRDWHEYEPPADAAWSWKNICKVKNLMKAGYTDGHWTADPRGYSIRNGYEWLRMQQPKQDWVNRTTGALPPKVCLKQKVHFLVLAACYYQVWTQRNNVRMNHVLLKPDKVTEHIIDEVRSRIRRKLKEPVSSSDKVWLAKWGML